MKFLFSDDYYALVQAGRKDSDGISYLGPEHILLLKARAWIDLADRKAAGDRIDSKAVKKHKNDVLRLYQIVDPELNGTVPESIKDPRILSIGGGSCTR